MQGGIQAWMVLGLLSALFAAFVGIAGKRGMEAVDPTLATAIRGVIMATALCGLTLALGKQSGLAGVSRAGLAWTAVSALCGAASWLCYFAALRDGPAGGVIALDRLSVVFALILAALVLREKLTPAVILGGVLMTTGALLIARGK